MGPIYDCKKKKKVIKATRCRRCQPEEWRSRRKGQGHRKRRRWSSKSLPFWSWYAPWRSPRSGTRWRRFSPGGRSVLRPRLCNRRCCCRSSSPSKRCRFLPNVPSWGESPPCRLGGRSSGWSTRTARAGSPPPAPRSAPSPPPGPPPLLARNSRHLRSASRPGIGLSRIARPCFSGPVPVQYYSIINTI